MFSARSQNNSSGAGQKFWDKALQPSSVQETPGSGNRSAEEQGLCRFIDIYGHSAQYGVTTIGIVSL